MLKMTTFGRVSTAIKRKTGCKKDPHSLADLKNNHKRQNYSNHRGTFNCSFMSTVLSE